MPAGTTMWRLLTRLDAVLLSAVLAGWHRVNGGTNIACANRRSHDLIDAVTSSYIETQ
ncbi:hypothetical protein [Actinoplanes siamensis]|uniref:hypothetical protein n=1 Tax=Actinoplanes siamensis TaxID=1223317 RepID=UPI001940950F|nr:hypothetical protein [Actinoplanes siamensis]